MSHSLICINCSRPTLYYWGMGLKHIKLAVNRLISPMALCSALGAGVVGKELWHRCGNITLKVMCEDRWASHPWLFTWSFNIVTFAGEDGTITICSRIFLAVEEMDGRCFDITLNRLAFMKDEMRKNVGFNESIIYCSWLQNVNQRIVLIHDRINAKMASASNDSGGGTGSGRFGNIEGLVGSLYKQDVKEIVKDINEYMAVLYVQLSRFGKDMELLQKTMESMCTDMMSLQQKVENIEIKVETASVGVLKELFGFGEGMVPNAVSVANAAIDGDPEPRADGVEELVTTGNEASGGEIDLGSSG